MDRETIKFKLKKKGYSLSMIADALNCSPVSVQLVIKGQHRSYRIANAIATSLELPIEQVFPDVPSYLDVNHFSTTRKQRVDDLKKRLTVNEPPAYSSESLARLIDDAIDKELPFIKKPHLLEEFLSKRNNTSHFDFEGILSVIIKIFEQALADLSLTLNPAEKGEAIESLLMLKLLQVQKYQQFGLLGNETLLFPVPAPTPTL